MDRSVSKSSPWKKLFVKPWLTPAPPKLMSQWLTLSPRSPQPRALKRKRSLSTSTRAKTPSITRSLPTKSESNTLMETRTRFSPLARKTSSSTESSMIASSSNYFHLAWRCSSVTDKPRQKLIRKLEKE